MRNLWVNALVKTLIFLVIIHVVLLLLGNFFRTDIGIFNLPMLWAHWSDNWVDAIIGLIATGIIYLIIYCSTKKKRNIESES